MRQQANPFSTWTASAKNSPHNVANKYTVSSTVSYISEEQAKVVKCKLIKTTRCFWTAVHSMQFTVYTVIYDSMIYGSLIANSEQQSSCELDGCYPVQFFQHWSYDLPTIIMRWEGNHKPNARKTSRFSPGSSIVRTEVPVSSPMARGVSCS
jgi:hypothetical protein